MRPNQTLSMFHYLVIGTVNAMLVSGLLVSLNIVIRILYDGVSHTSLSWETLVLGFAVDMTTLTAISFLIIALPQYISMAYWYGRRRFWGCGYPWYWAMLEMCCATGLIFAVWMLKVGQDSLIDAIQLAFISGFCYGVLPFLFVHQLEKYHRQLSPWGWLLNDASQNAGQNSTANSMTILTPFCRGLVAITMLAMLSFCFFLATAWKDGLSMILVFSTWLICLLSIPLTIGMLYIVARQTRGKRWWWILAESVVLIIFAVLFDILLQQFTSYTDYWVSGVALLSFIVSSLSCALVWVVEKIVVRMVLIGWRRKNKAML